MKNSRRWIYGILVFCISLLVWKAAAHGQLRLLPGDANLGLAAGNQNTPAVAQGGDKILAVWSDSRANPTSAYEYETSKDIYGARLDANGEALDSLPIAIAAGRSSQENPKVSWNGSNWLVVFESYDVGGTGYYYQKSLQAVRVAPDGQVLDPEPIKLFGLTPAGIGWAVASDGDQWVVVNQGTSTSGDIVAVRISAGGVVLDPPTRALVEATYYMRSNLNLAYAGGVFLLTYDEMGTGSSASAAVRFNSELNLLDATPLTFLDTPVAGLATNGNSFYVVWNRQNPDFTVVVAGSRVNTLGQRLDGNGVNISGSKQPYAYATTAVTWDGVNWRVTWGEFSTTYVARVNSAGSLLDPGSVAVPGPQTGPTAGTGNGGVQIVWSVFANNNYDVYSAKISPTNTATPNRPLSVAAPRQLRPALATNGSGYMLVYHSSTASEVRVLAQPLDAQGDPIGTGPIQLDSGSPTNGPGSPSVAWNGAVYMVAWGNPAGVVAQRLQPNGTKVDPAPFVVMSPAFGPANVAALGSDFLVTGLKMGFNIQYIFPVAARVSGAGAVLDATPLVLGNSFVSRRPAVVALGTRWLVAWIRNATHDDPYALTMGAFIPPVGAPTGEFQIHGPFSTAGGNGIFEMDMASNGSAALMVQPQELTSGVETDLLSRFIQADGTVSAMTNLTPWAGNQYRPRIAWDGTNFIVVYQEQKNRLALWTLDQLDARSDLYGMRISTSGIKVDPQGFVFSAQPTGETDPNITASNGFALLAGALVINDTNFANYRIAYEIRPANGPVAIINASTTAGDIPLTVNFDSGNPFGAPPFYAWDFDDGSTSTSPNPSHTFSVAGEYLVSLTVSDELGRQSTQAQMINATNPNQIPVAVATANKTSGNAPLSVIFYADGSYDPDGFVGNIEWLFSDGGTYWGSTAYHTFTTTGNHTVTLRVYDSRGAIGTTNLTINVGGVNQPPVAKASATPTSGNAPLTVQFSSAGSSDPDGTISAYRWDFGDVFGVTSSDPNPTYTYGYAGTYTAKLTVTDNNGVSNTVTVTITVNPAPLPAIISSDLVLSASSKRGVVNVNGTVTVTDAAGAKQSGANVTVTWTLPGGATQSQSALTDRRGNAKFSISGASGTYTLTVTDIAKSGYSFDATQGVTTKSITK